MAILIPQGKQQYDGILGLPLVGGKLFTYAAGTNTPKTTWADAAGTIPNTNPIILDARGEATVFWLGAYKVVLQDALGNLIWTVDNIQATDWQAVIDAAIDGLGTTSGAGEIGFSHSIAYARGTVGEHLRHMRYVTDFPYNATGDGTTNDLAAINAALAQGGDVYLPGPTDNTQRTYKCDGRVLMPIAGTRLLVGSNVTLLVNGGKWNGTQTPFLNCVHITADNCDVKGHGISSIIKNNASDANVVGWLHCGGGSIDQIVLDGDKVNVPGITDDTFQNGLCIINTAAGNPNDTPSQTFIGSIWVRNCTQYGFNIYGDLARGIRGVGFHIENIGRVGDAQSVGGGIAATKGIRELVLTGFEVFDCKGPGVFEVAGDNAFNITLSGFNIARCGTHGISITEQLNFGSIAGNGAENIAVGPGTITGCSGAGVLLGVYDDSGYVRKVSLTGVVATGNAYGLLAQTGSDATNRLGTVTATGCTFTNNTIMDLAIGPNNRFVLHDGNSIGTVSDAQIAFTPTIAGSTVSGTPTYSAGGQAGAFQKTGDNTVWISIVLDWTTLAGATGSLVVGGLPFTAASDEPVSLIQVAANRLASTGFPHGSVAAGGTTINILKQEITAGVVNTAAIAVDTDANLRLTGVYRI